jgi:ceramide glucosyltransferase
MMVSALLWIAVAGLTGATVFLGLVLLAARRFQNSSRRARADASLLPAVTLLKPLHGAEPGLRENLESFFRLNYRDYEIIFGARHADDPALAVVDLLSQRYPYVPVKVIVAGEPEQPNAKVCALKKMVAAASHDYLVMSDSDVRVAPHYIQEVVRPLLDPGVGLVTCLYRGVPTGGVWSRLEALGMSIEMTSGVLVADMLEGMRFALGPTMATRKDVVSKIGGIGVLADYCADDYVLGKLVAEAGLEVVLSHHVIEHVCLNQSLRQSLLHQARWMKSTRFSRTWGHIGTGMTFAVPFGLLGLGAALAGGHPVLGAFMLAAAFANRVVQALVVGCGIVNDPNALRYFWLYPARDLLGGMLWAWSFVGGRIIVWRDQQYRLLNGGRMCSVDAAAPAPPVKRVIRPHAEISR